MPRPVSIEVRDLHKQFIVRDRRRSKRRGLPRRPAGTAPSRVHKVLEGISFDVHQGEFFGVLGRNGCGKSTLLKLICGVYGPDSGSIRVAGEVAPFLELGIGFNPLLAAEENILINGVMMGLTPREARRRSDEIIEFAGLGDYTDLELKNYSSGMRVRLGFAVMTHVDADILLIDEVLAVGDAEFQERCGETFVEMHRQGRTVILVTHSNAAVTAYCDRAMIIDEGAISLIGGPAEANQRYMEINAQAAMRDGSAGAAAIREALEDPSGRFDETTLTAETFGRDEPIRIRGTVVYDRPMAESAVELRLSTSAGMIFNTGVSPIEGSAEAGERREFELELENHLKPGLYQATLTVVAPAEKGGWEMRGTPLPLRFEVEGKPGVALVSLPQRLRTAPATSAGSSLSSGREGTA